MVWSSVAYDAGELDAFNADNPVIVGHNVCRDIVDGRWTTTGTQAGTDVTQASNPVRRAWDGRGTLQTNFSGTSNTVYLNLQISPSTIDTCCIIFADDFTSSTVTVQIADDAAFTTNVHTFAGPFTAQTGCRLVRSFDDGDRYEDVEYVRIRIQADSGNHVNTPAIAEFFLGRGRVLSQWWAYGSDSQPARSKSVDNDTDQGDRSRYLHHYARHMARHAQELSNVGMAVLDDIATIRALSTESRDFTRPVLYLPRPISDANRAMLGFPPKDGVNIPQTSNGTYDYSWDFDEQPPFFDLEVCGAGAAPFSNDFSYIFDGTGDYIDFGDVADFDGAVQCTWSFWFYQNPISTVDFIWTKRTNLSQMQFWIATASGDRIDFSINPTLTTNAIGRTPAASILDDTWHHIVCVFNGNGVMNAGRMQVYIDGVPQVLGFTGTVPALMTSGSTATMQIGAQNAASSLDGNLDELACWVGQSASQTEVDALYNSGTPANASTAGLGPPTFYYRADNDTPGVAVDEGTAGVDGTYFGNTAQDTNIP